MDRRRFIGQLGIWAASPLIAACATPGPDDPFTPPDGDEQFRPSFGQAGKDVIWVPTPDLMVRRMLERARITSQDVVFDLGSGDGKIPIAAARLYRAKATGIEYEPRMADLARRNARRARVADKVDIITGDIFDPAVQQRFMSASVITMYLNQNLNLKLRPTLLKMKPGTRVVSHAFHMVDWEPDDVVTVGNAEGYYWVVPAEAAGRWRIRPFEAREATVDVVQRYQRVGGTITIDGRTQQLLGPYLNGDVFGFTFEDTDGDLRSIRTRIVGDRLEGALRRASLVSIPLQGERVR